MATKISWTDETWNPIVGCCKVSSGCENCYAEKLAARIAAGMGSASMRLTYQKVSKDGRWTGVVAFERDRLHQPQRWKKPRRIFVSSMGDLFHERVPFRWVDDVYNVARECPQHTFQWLTKRPSRMVDYANEKGRGTWLPNIWVGVTAENQKCADERIPKLLEIPAAVRFVSVEPMLDWVPITKYLKTGGISWVILGAESGPKRRPIPKDAVYNLVCNCKAYDVCVFVKQLHYKGKVIKPGDPNWPDWAVQQWPNTLMKGI